MLKNDLLMLADLTPEWFEQIVARSIMLKQIKLHLLSQIASLIAGISIDGVGQSSQC